MTYNYTGMKNETAVKKQARIDLDELFKEFLVEKFGEEKVKLIGPHTYGFACGEANDKDGFLVDVCGYVKIGVKDYQDHNGEKRQKEAFDLELAADLYQKDKCGIVK